MIVVELFVIFALNRRMRIGKSKLEYACTHFLNNNRHLLTNLYLRQHSPGTGLAGITD